jgi:predicted DNA-binding protein with PD1-like motif
MSREWEVATVRTKLLNDAPERTFAVIFEPGEEVLSQLQEFAAAEHLAGSRLTAIGGFSETVLGFYQPDSRSYKEIPVSQQVEVLSMIGDVALGDDGRPHVHAHVVVGCEDGTARGGHLLRALVTPTLEVLLTESPNNLQRRHDAETGLSLIRI